MLKEEMEQQDHQISLLPNDKRPKDQNFNEVLLLFFIDENGSCMATKAYDLQCS